MTSNRRLYHLHPPPCSPLPLRPAWTQVRAAGLPALGSAFRAQLHLLANVRLHRLRLLLPDARHVLLRGVHDALDAVVVQRIVDDAVLQSRRGLDVLVVLFDRRLAVDREAVLTEPLELSVVLVLPDHGRGGCA